MKVGFFILLGGLLIALIISWIYDIHPEEGMVKTEPTNNVSEEIVPPSFKGWKIASYISFVVIVGLIVLNVIPYSGKKEILDKSIAVLPFESLSNDPNLQYQADGIMDAILLHLSKIEDLRVMSRTSVEQYRDTKKSIPEIFEEMGVSYVLEGSFQKSGNQIRLIVQLIQTGTEGHLWANNYDREWEDIFAVQSEVAQTVAKELKAVLKPEELELIEKIPTTSLMAKDFYQRGKEEYVRFLINVSNQEALEQSKIYFHKALDHDSTFAQDYSGLAMSYFSTMISLGPTNYIVSEDYLDNQAFDKILYLINKALHYDNQLSEAYVARGKYYFETGKREKAERDYNHALDLNPNQWEAYFLLGELFFEVDNIMALEYMIIAASIDRGSQMSLPLFRIWQISAYSLINIYRNPPITELLKLSLDSATYYISLAMLNTGMGNIDKADEYVLKAYAIDSTLPWVIGQRIYLSFRIGNYQEGIKFLNKYICTSSEWGKVPIQELHRIGNWYFQAGFYDDAELWIDKQEEISLKLVQLHRPLAQTSYAQYGLAAVYSFKGQKAKAIELLNSINQRSNVPLVIGYYLESDPLFDKIRDDIEFQTIERELIARFKNEQERIRQWLEENDML